MEERRTGRFRAMKSLYWTARRAVNSLVPGDVRTEWLAAALLRAVSMIRAGGYDAVITAHEPWVDCHIGLILKGIFPRLPWIADFGDPYVAPYTPAHKLPVERRIERLVYSRADALVFTTGAVVERLLGLHPFLEGMDIRVIGQGFSLAEAERAGEAPPPNDVFTLAYTGIFYRGLRDPAPLAAALSGFGRPFKFVIAGRNEAFTGDFAPAGRGVEFAGFVDHLRALEIQKSADVLVHVSNSNTYQVPGKIYEYLGARRPILCIVSSREDAAAELVGRLDCGEVCLNDPASITASLGRMHERWKSGTTPPPPPLSSIRAYSWEERARDFRSLAGEVVNKKKGGSA
jgi:hypothetical protein